MSTDTKEQAILNNFCNNLNRMISQKGTTQRKLADYVGVSYPTANTWVKGKKIPRMDKIDRICQFFMCSRSDLLDSPATKKSTDLTQWIQKAAPDVGDKIKSIIANGSFESNGKTIEMSDEDKAVFINYIRFTIAQMEAKGETHKTISAKKEGGE